MNKKIVYVNFAVLGLLALVVIYLLFQNQKIIGGLIPNTVNRELQEQETVSPQAEATTSASPKKLTIIDTQAAILEITNNTDRSTFANYMADTVNVLLYATDCCQPQNKQSAISQLSYINEGLPITFDQKNTTIVNLKAKNPQLADTYMGISQTKEHMIAYTIDPQTAKITDIQMSVSWKLYNQ